MERRRVTVLTLLAGIFLVGSAAQASAAVILYTDRAAFNAALSGQTLIDFELADPRLPYRQFFASTGSTYPGVTFTESTERLFVVDPTIYGTNTTDYLNVNAGSNLLTATFAQSVFGAGMDLGYLPFDSVEDQAHVQITLSTGDTFGITAPNMFSTQQPMSFLGFISDIAFSSIVMDNAAKGIMVDNFAYSSVAPGSEPPPVPEPASLLMLGAGIVGAGVRRWRQQPKA